MHINMIIQTAKRGIKWGNKWKTEQRVWKDLDCKSHDCIDDFCKPVSCLFGPKMDTNSKQPPEASCFADWSRFADTGLVQTGCKAIMQKHKMQPTLWLPACHASSSESIPNAELTEQA